VRFIWTGGAEWRARLREEGPRIRRGKTNLVSPPRETSTFPSVHLPLLYSYGAYFSLRLLLEASADNPHARWDHSRSLICESIHEPRFDGSIGVSETAKPPPMGIAEL